MVAYFLPLSCFAEKESVFLTLKGVSKNQQNTLLFFFLRKPKGSQKRASHFSFLFPFFWKRKPLSKKKDHKQLLKQARLGKCFFLRKKRGSRGSRGSHLVFFFFLFLFFLRKKKKKTIKKRAVPSFL